MNSKEKNKASLVVVGCGIKFLAHLTVEAKTYIKHSDKVLYLVNEPAMKSWIQKNNSSAESLDDIYVKHHLRIDSYHEITQYILEQLRKGQHVCVVLYGHPSVFSKPGLDAVLQARREGFEAKILPGISAEDCIFADLLIDPGSSGCQSYEATDFLVNRKKIDVTSHLILWQIAVIGLLSHQKEYDPGRGLSLLVDYLKDFYDPKQQVFLYMASQYPHFNYQVENFILEELPNKKINRIAMLYIPPAKKSVPNEEVLKLLTQ